MKFLSVVFLAVLALAVLPACNTTTGPNLPSLVVNEPNGGNIVIGTPTNVSWTCAGCEAILGTRGVAVYASGPTRTARVPIGVGGPTDSFTWIAGSVLGDGPSLEPGAYRIVVEALPAGGIPLTGTGEPFQLIVTIR